MGRPSTLIRPSNSTSGYTAITSRTTGPAFCPLQSSHTTTPPVPLPASCPSLLTKVTILILRSTLNATWHPPAPVSLLLTWTNSTWSSIPTSAAEVRFGNQFEPELNLNGTMVQLT